MKKLMFAAVVTAGFVANASSESQDEKASQVYEITMTAKTTVAKSGTVSTKKNPFVAQNGTIVYRNQGTQKWKGLLWGCDCNSIKGSWQVVSESAKSVSGCVIWNTKSYEILFLDDMKWRLLNAIGATGKNCEGCWTIGDSSDNSNAFMAFSGFGTLVVNYSSDLCESQSLNCTSYIKSMSGNMAGWMPAPSITTAGTPGTCTFCGGGNAGTADETNVATAWDFCPCEEFGDYAFTAVSGTWTLKYNSSMSKKLKNYSSITDVASMPSSVKAQVLTKIAETLGN